MKEDLLVRRAQAENSFNELIKKREEKEAEIREIDTELARLQGEYRVIEGLINEKDSKAVSPAPDVINVDKAIKDKKK